MEYVDDIIREKKREWYKTHNTPPNFRFFWGKTGYEQLRNYLVAVLVCPHGLNCFTCDYGERKVDKILKKGFRFMGVSHFWDKRKNEFLISVKNI